MTARPKIIVSLLALSGLPAARADNPSLYAARAREVTQHIQRTFFDPKTGVYLKSLTIQKPDYVWLQSVMFSNLVAAARNDPKTYRPMLDRYFAALESYWDPKVKIPGYEPAPTRGNGTDKYYDDNAWLAITFLEAYETNHNPRYLARADQTLRFVLSGWDEEAGGGIWWHQSHKDGTKNACSNAPAAVGCLRLAKFRDGRTAAALVEQARKIVEWMTAKLEASDGLFDDRIVVATGEVKRGKLTYNSALMLRAVGPVSSHWRQGVSRPRPANRQSRRAAPRREHGRLSRRRPLLSFHDRGRSRTPPRHGRRRPAQASQEKRRRLLRALEDEPS